MVTLISSHFRMTNRRSLSMQIGCSICRSVCLARMDTPERWVTYSKACTRFFHWARICREKDYEQFILKPCDLHYKDRIHCPIDLAGCTAIECNLALKFHSDQSERGNYPHLKLILLHTDFMVHIRIPPLEHRTYLLYSGFWRYTCRNLICNVRRLLATLHLLVPNILHFMS